jgi:hypothetical protein
MAKLENPDLIMIIGQRRFSKLLNHPRRILASPRFGPRWLMNGLEQTEDIRFLSSSKRERGDRQDAATFGKSMTST